MTWPADIDGDLEGCETDPGYGGAQPIVHRVCAACPWRRSNYRKPDPTDPAVRNDPNYQPGWYTLKNLKRLWNGLRDGEIMSCHPTDPDNPGSKADAQVKPCAGQLILVMRSVKRYEQCTETHDPRRSFGAYRRGPGIRMTRTGMLAWALRLSFKRAGPIITGVPADFLPDEIPEKDVRACGVPWEDSVLNG